MTLTPDLAVSMIAALAALWQVYLAKQGVASSRSAEVRSKLESRSIAHNPVTFNFRPDPRAERRSEWREWNATGRRLRRECETWNEEE